MTIWHPIPHNCLSVTQALQEHFDILTLVEQIEQGVENKMTQRWARYENALYDRYARGMHYIALKGIELIDNWPCPPIAMGANAVYPEISFEERVDMWHAIYVMNTAIEYEM